MRKNYPVLFFDSDGDYTQLRADWDSKSWILKLEEALTIEEVVERFLAGSIDFCADTSLIHLLEQRTGRTLV